MKNGRVIEIEWTPAPTIPPMRSYTLPQWSGALPEMQWRGDRRSAPGWPNGYFEMRFNGSNMEVRSAGANADWLRVQDFGSLQDAMAAASSKLADASPKQQNRKRWWSLGGHKAT